MDLRFKSGLRVFAFFTLCSSAPCFGQSAQETPAPVAQQPGAEQPGRDRKVSGSISGTVLDQSGAVLAGARVALTRTGENRTGENQSADAQSPRREVLSGEG